MCEPETMVRRFLTMCVPGKGDEPGTYYVYDRLLRDCVRCASRQEAAELARQRNAETEECDQ